MPLATRDTSRSLFDFDAKERAYDAATFMQHIYIAALVFLGAAVIALIGDAFSVSSCTFLVIQRLLQMGDFVVATENSLHRIRKAFYNSVLHQDIAWRDQQASGAITSLLNEFVPLHKDENRHRSHCEVMSSAFARA